MTSTDNLTQAEHDLAWKRLVDFVHRDTEAAYQAWAAKAMGDKRYANSRKQFLMRLRFLFQQGKL